MHITRRTVLSGSLVLLTGCRVDAPYIEDELLPVAHGPEEVPMSQPAGLTQPLVLWGSVVAEPNTDATVPNEQLANPFNMPMEMLGMRVRVYPVHEEDNFQRTVGGSIKVKLDLGAAAVAADFPIADFGTTREMSETEGIIFSTPGLAAGLGYALPTVYDWRLKYPLFVPAGKVVSAVFTPVGLNANKVRIDVLYFCRTWDANRPIPSRIKVPWAASFESKTFELVTDAPPDSAVSPNLDIVNPFTAPLELQRISGRVSALAQGFENLPNFIYEDQCLFRSVISSLRMRSSRGFDLVRTPVPFDGIFPINWRSWDVPEGWSMAPQEYYRVQIDTRQPPLAIKPELSAQAQFSVGIVGYREVDVASLGGSL